MLVHCRAAIRRHTETPPFRQALAGVQGLKPHDGLIDNPKRTALGNFRRIRTGTGTYQYLRNQLVPPACPAADGGDSGIAEQVVHLVVLSHPALARSCQAVQTSAKLLGNRKLFTLQQRRPE